MITQDNAKCVLSRCPSCPSCLRAVKPIVYQGLLWGEDWFGEEGAGFLWNHSALADVHFLLFGNKTQVAEEMQGHQQSRCGLEYRSLVMR